MKILTLIRPAEIKVNSGSVAIIQNDKENSYSEINSIVEKISSFLNEKGIKENDIVTLLFNNSLEFIVTILALWEIRAVPVPLNTKLLKKDLIEQIKFLNSIFTIRSKEFENLTTSKKSIIIPFENLPEEKQEIETSEFTKDRTALILSTSGSSGKPKAVMLSFNNLIQSAVIGNKVLKQTSKDKWLASLPFYHIGGFSIIFRALIYGTAIIIPDSLSNNGLVKSIKRNKPTLVSLISNQLKKLVDSDFIPPKELRMVLLGGGFSDKDLILRAVDKGWKIAKVYGSTETSSFVSFMNTEEVKKKPGASGKAIYPNKIIITDKGEIALRSPAIMKGYFNNYDKTFSKLKNDFYYTGDIGYLDDDGYLFVETKRNNLIITGGENVNPIEVETSILAHAKVEETCVVGLEDDQWGQIVSAVVVLKENCKLSEKELRNFLREKLASFKIPKKIKFINHLPKSELGKVLRKDVKRIIQKEE